VPWISYHWISCGCGLAGSHVSVYLNGVWVSITSIQITCVDLMLRWMAFHLMSRVYLNCVWVSNMTIRLMCEFDAKMKGISLDFTWVLKVIWACIGQHPRMTQTLSLSLSRFLDLSHTHTCIHTHTHTLSLTHTHTHTHTEWGSRWPRIRWLLNGHRCSIYYWIRSIS